MACRPTPYSIALSALIVLHYSYEGSTTSAPSGPAAASPLYSNQHSINNDNNNDDDDNDNDDSNNNDSIIVIEELRHNVQAFLQETLQQHQEQEASSSLLEWSRTTDKSIASLVQALYRATSCCHHSHYSNEQRQRLQSILLAKTFVQWLSVASESLDAMMDLLTTLQLSVTHANPVVDATSVSGIYIRAVCCLGFPQLSFTETGRLWKHFAKQVQEAATVTGALVVTTDTTTAITTSSSPLKPENAPSPLVRKRNNKNYTDDHSKNEADALSPREDDCRTHDDEWSLSPDQMENLLRQECHRMGPGRVSNVEGMKRLEEGIWNILKHHPELPSAHFLRFLHCLQTKERVGAIDALHAYFDNVLSLAAAAAHSSYRDRGAASRSTTPNGATAFPSFPEADLAARQLAAQHFFILQFAAILLAALHYETGDLALARLATTEAVRVAQQSAAQQQQRPTPSSSATAQNAQGNSNNNTSLMGGASSCVAYSLGWLALTSGAMAGDDSQDREWMAKCVERAIHNPAGNLSALVAGASLIRVRQALEQSASEGGLQAAWGHLFAAATAPRNAETAEHAHDCPLHMARIPNSDAAVRILAQQRAMAAAIWNAYNQPALSGLASALALGKEYHHVAVDIQNMARSLLCGSKQSSFFLSCGSQQQVDYCVYGQALYLMSTLLKAFGLPMDASFCQEMALILHEWAVRRGDLAEAEGWMRFLLGNLHPGMTMNTTIEIDVRMQQSLLFSAQQEWNAAKQILKDLLKQLRKKGSKSLPLQTAWVLLRLGLVLLQEESSPSSGIHGQQDSSNSCTNALPYLLECLLVCDEHQMDGMHATCMSILAIIHLKMQRMDAAIAMIEAALPNLLQQGHVWFQAQAYLTLAKCHLTKQQQQEEEQAPSSRKRKKTFFFFMAANRALAQSQQLFERCQDGPKLREVYYLKANVCHFLGDNCQREQASQRFLALSSYLSKADRPGNVFENVLYVADHSKLEQVARRSYA